MATVETDPVREDRIDREGVLMFLLDQPGLVTIQEVVTYIRAYYPSERHAETRGGTERAIRDLAGAGVLNIVDGSVQVSHATREVAYLIEGNTTGRAT